jgi:hypothetical protein
VEIPFGMYCGTRVEVLVLKHPAYVMWLLGEDADTNAFAAVQRRLGRLIAVFGGKRFVMRCAECGKRATRCSVYHGNVSLSFWCGKCSPCGKGASPEKLEIIQSYSDAVWYVQWWCNGRKRHLELIVRNLAQAKGLGSQVRECDAAAFFCV